MLAFLTALSLLWAIIGAQGTVDLSEILATPPSADYADDANNIHQISGPFDAHRYSAWLGSSSDDAKTLEGEFAANGFVRGYARSWVATSTRRAQIGEDGHNYLVETVEEYSSDVGARWRYDGIVKYTNSPAGGLVRGIKTSIQDSFGAVAASGSYYFVTFAKGNDLYIVRMESQLEDMTQSVSAQAQAQFDRAPPDTIPRLRWTTVPREPSAAVARISVRNVVPVTIALLVALAAGLAIFEQRRRRSRLPRL